MIGTIDKWRAGGKWKRVEKKLTDLSTAQSQERHRVKTTQHLQSIL
jgi:hypothetical protein